jgi:hypothetical protein
MIRLGLDFDNTLISYDALFKKVALEQGLIPETIAANKNAVRDYLRSEHREDDWTRLQGEVYGNRILDATPYPGMKKVLEYFSKREVPLAIVSHKTKTPFLGEPWDLHTAARHWLEKEDMHSKLGPNIDRSNTFFELTKEAKRDRIVSLRCTHYVDDLPEILAMLPASITKIHFSPETYPDKKEEDWLVMRSWDQLTSLIMIP